VQSIDVGLLIVEDPLATPSLLIVEKIAFLEEGPSPQSQCCGARYNQMCKMCYTFGVHSSNDNYTFSSKCALLTHTISSARVDAAYRYMFN